MLRHERRAILSFRAGQGGKLAELQGWSATVEPLDAFASRSFNPHHAPPDSEHGALLQWPPPDEIGSFSADISCRGVLGGRNRGKCKTKQTGPRLKGQLGQAGYGGKKRDVE